MEKHYHHLSTTDRVTLMFLKRQGLSLRAIASELNRSPSNPEPGTAAAYD
jgi:IS30 family transposase